MKLTAEGFKEGAKEATDPQWRRILTVLLGKAGLTELTLTVDDIINSFAADTLHVTFTGEDLTIRRVNTQQPIKNTWGE